MVHVTIKKSGGGRVKRSNNPYKECFEITIQNLTTDRKLVAICNAIMQ